MVELWFQFYSIFEPQMLLVTLGWRQWMRRIPQPILIFWRSVQWTQTEQSHPECSIIWMKLECHEPHPPKVVAKRVQKIQYWIFGQKGQIIIIGCGNAVRQCQQPFIVYAAKQLNALWTRGNNAIRGGLFFFFRFKEHFLAHAINCHPLLLLFDSHSSHFEPANIMFTNLKKTKWQCLNLPSHTTHKCQPLDCSYFGSLNKHWQEVCHSFNQANPGQVISKLNFCWIVKE